MPFDPTTPEPGTKRSRGRPKGAKAAVTKTFSSLTKSHFAFVRAVVNGLPIKNAWQIYMTTADSEEVGPREMASTYRFCAKTILELAQVHENSLEQAQKQSLQNAPHGVFSTVPSPAPVQGEKTLQGPKKAIPADLGKTTEKTTIESVRTLVQSLSSLPAQQIRTEEFAGLPSSPDDVMDYAEFSEDFHAGDTALRPTEAEIRQAYKRYLDNLGKEARFAVVLAEASRERKISAINSAENLLSFGPRPDTPCGLWLDESLTQLLRANVSVNTLRELCDLVTQGGVTWQRLVPGIGTTRARELEKWLNAQKHLTALLPRSGLKRVASPRNESFALSQVDTNVKQFGIVPLDMLAPPFSMDGSQGHFRSPHKNTLGASTDLEAIQAWLKLTDSEVSRRAYEKEATRFYLWCLLVKRRALSDLDATDCADYRDFLANVPADWQMNAPYPRGHAEWRPFLSALSPRSQSYALKVIGILFNALHLSSYLAANAMREVSKVANASSANLVDLDTTRTLHKDAQRWLFDHLDALPSSAFNRRKRAIIWLAVEGGMRRSEMSQATWGQVTAAYARGATTNDFEIRIVGKGGRPRRIPIMRKLYQELLQHQEDWLAVSDQAKSIPPEDRPLIAALEKPVHQFTGKSQPDGDLQAQGIRNPIDRAAVMAMPNGALSPHGIYKAIRTVFRDVARTQDIPDEDKAVFLKASVHWLRHTFAHSILESTHGDLSITQELLGHASLETTGKYLKQDSAAKLEAVRTSSAILRR